MSRDVYPYEPLTSGDVFRYIDLQPGSGDEPLRCSLRTANIADTHFEAISYVWGKHPVKDQTITCDMHLMTITTNLSTVLRRVRLSDRPRTLWADGISINQGNLQEKGYQVGLMGKIYQATSCVLIYIGADEELRGPEVYSLLQEVDKKIAATRQSIDMDWDSFPYPDEENYILYDPRWTAFHSLLAQDWFDRGWVVQEAALAPRGQFIWGDTIIDWSVMMRVYIWLSTRATKTYQSLRFAEYRINSHLDIYLETHQEYGKAFYDELSWGTPSILRTLNCAKELDLKNPSDRIYAFMNLPQWSEHHVRVTPNYFRPYLEVYQEFATQYISITRDTRLLDYVSHDSTSISQSPSWVPRWDISAWSVSQSCEVSSLAQSRSGSSEYPEVLETGILKVCGVIIDAVRYASDVFEWNTTSATTIREIWKQIGTAIEDSPYTASGSTTLIVFLDALTAGTIDGSSASDWRTSRDAFARQVLARDAHTPANESAPDAIMQTPTSPDHDAVAGATHDAELYLEHMRSRTENRKFIITERGYMGLAPGLARQGDTCGIVFGCKTPCILRKGDGDEYHTYIGATFLVGNKCYDMDGGGKIFCNVMSEEDSKDWVDWDVEEQSIYLC